MSKQPLFVAFTNQKGGVGKSAVTVLMASYFHYVKDKNVLVVDCDFPQHSVHAMRERDKQSLMKNDRYKELIAGQYDRTQKKAWNVVTAQPEEAVQAANKALASPRAQYDLVLFDLPGTVNTPGMFTTLFNMDYVFIPITADRMIMQSSLSFAGTLQDFKSGHREVPLKELYLIWNKVDNRVSKEVFDFYNEIIKRMKLKVLDTILPESQRYNREMSVNSGSGRLFFRCTLHPPMPKLLKGSNIDLLAEEVINLINL